MCGAPTYHADRRGLTQAASGGRVHYVGGGLT
ncbi:hypothetical protein GGQ68_004392 [Sagittula marina]|uniref:Uncharacterized protein n=1 Tax=Sagittula marina TaxID=943940 RepID=A0A7W6GTY2_9RHOB|nr:hypothetical protein [Sagittula marina]